MDSDFAHELPPLRQSSFHLPHTDGLAHHYLCGNSLGLQPKRVAHFIDESLHKWRTQAVEGHFTDPAPWMDYHQLVRDDLAKLVGAKPIEVVAMNSLSVNLHLLLTSFYRPTPMRHKILIESRAFPSDHHIVASQIRLHGLDPATTLLQLPCDDAGLYAMDNIVELLSREGEQIALVLLPGVQYVTGQAFDLQRITRAAKAAGCVVGFDLAHAVGNIQVDLHAIGCDFAAWCSYKYLNAGPGAVAGAFVHERHANAFDLPRLSGWWGHDPASRFLMAPEFIPTPGADGWQLSNPPIFALAPLRASLEIFRDVGIEKIQSHGRALSGLLIDELDDRFDSSLHVLTPQDARQRGAQVSVRVQSGRDAGRALFAHLASHHVIGDWREPDVIRLTPAPLYCGADDVRACIDAIASFVET
jgi:kynureninase